eukprot:TRINITY_DN453_c1_g1_i4.p1 TRINITY_DN453_c1_g1~~TRINITY_DN453_c1_g1_i4.p1  ORF type:complete len:281 (+),score=45.96 TRINITY_DN453_c1_g1_i4:708-1550(+)
MVSEHNSRGFDGDWIGGTFSLAVAGNGLVAIASGFAAQGAVWAYNGHPVAPFDLSALALILGTLLITFTWPENYGDSQASQSQGLQKALTAVKNDSKIAMLGLIQALFEGAMYTFVFVWTPILEDKGAVPHGFVFASFMISCSIGATVFNYLSANQKPQQFLVGTFLAAAAAMAGPVMIDSPLVIMVCFCVFEVCVGIFWPAIMSLRSAHLPEEGRATIMNIFRIPLNAVVCLVLANQGSLSVKADFAICACAHVFAAICTIRLAGLIKASSASQPTSSI